MLPLSPSCYPTQKGISLSLRLLLICAAGIAQVKTLQVDVPSSWERRCQIPATVTRDSDDDPETFVVAYVEDSLSFTSFFATPTDTSLTPQTVLFSIASPGSVTFLMGDDYENYISCSIFLGYFTSKLPMILSPQC